jgi:pyruvate ferredoxin oxidoreductase alpha subunit
MNTKTIDPNYLDQLIPQASIGFELSAITEASAGVIGDTIEPMETFQDFTDKGTAVVGGSAGKRIWSDKSFVPITLKTQCIDCLHCVVACPHHAIGYDIEKKEASFIIQNVKQILNMIPGFTLGKETNHEVVHKSDTDYNFCKGCFVCASACPVDAIHFVPKEFVNFDIFKGAPIEPEEISSIFLPPVLKSFDLVEKISSKTNRSIKDIKIQSSTDKSIEELYNGSDMLGKFTFQAQIDMATMFPITPNTSLLKYLEDKSKKQDPNAEHYFTIRTCLSEESGYAWLTGGAVKGKRCLMAQGSQSMAQLFEHMNINPGLHLPVLMLELTRAIAPGTSIKPDHTTTLRTADTGEIIIFGRGIQDNYEKAILLLKLMESDGIWVPGRLVVKGFVETHTLSTGRQVEMKFLPDQKVQEFLGHPKNPFVFSETEVRSVGILDFDARYGEQRQAIDQVLTNAGKKFDEVANAFSKITGHDAIKKVFRFPEKGTIDLAIVSLNDPDMNTAELVAEQLIQKNINCGVISVNLYRPFPAEELVEALKGVKAIAILDYSNGSGRAGGAQFSSEVRSALYSRDKSAEIISVQVGLGGRALTIPYLLLVYRVLHDISNSKDNSKAYQWMLENAHDKVLSLGNRGNPLPQTDADFDIPITQVGVSQMVIVGKGGQGVLLLNGLLTGLASIQNKCAVSMVGYGALQRGGGITLSYKYSDSKIRDYSDIILTDTLVSFEDDIHLEAMLPQLKVGGTLILDGEPDRYAAIKNKLPDESKVIILPAKALAIKLYNNATRTNLILYGAILAHIGIKDEKELIDVISKLQTMPSVAKEANILTRPKGMAGLFSGFYAYKNATKEIDLEAADNSHTESIETIESFRQRILPATIDSAINNPEQLNKIKWRYNIKKKLYQLMFQFHPMVSQIQSMYLSIRGKTPISGGDMACGGCGQINIFRNVFNFLHFLQNQKGKILVSEQDGCGTVFSGMNRTSIWNIPYIRIAFETAHGIASGLTEGLDKDDIVVSISGDGGMMQGIRSVEDALHHQDPILHLVVVNQTLGNTGGQATSTTMVGTKTRDGHIAKQNAVNFLKIAEKHHVEGAFASSINLSDLYKKIRYAHHVIKTEKRPFLLIMNFSCLEQGMNLARSLSMQKIALDCHYFNLYSLRYRAIKNSSGLVLYYKKEINIDYFPFVFGKNAWKKKLKEYASHQAMMKEIHDDPIKLESAYGQLRGEWEEIKKEMGPVRYYWSFFKSIFSLSRITMMRLIRKKIPAEAEQ